MPASSASVPALCSSTLLYLTGRQSWWYFWRLYTEIQTKRMLYRKKLVTLHPKAYEI